MIRGNLHLGSLEDEEDKKATEQAADKLKPLLEKIKEVLGDKVKEVRVTHRLTNSPACLVADSHGMDASMERLLKMNQLFVSMTNPPSLIITP